MGLDQLRADATADAQLVIGESIWRGGAAATATAARIVAESYYSLHDMPIMNHNIVPIQSNTIVTLEDKTIN